MVYYLHIIQKPRGFLIMEDRMQIIECRTDSKVSIGVIPGHYATNHSHVNYYVDMTSIKHEDGKRGCKTACGYLHIYSR